MWEVFRKVWKKMIPRYCWCHKAKQEQSSGTWQKDSEVPTVTYDTEERMAADYDGNLGSRTPKEEVSRKYLHVEGSSSSLNQEKSTSRRDFCVARILRVESMNDFYTWPDTYKCKGKRQSERQPFAVTSEKYREMTEKNRLAKMHKKKPKEARTWRIRTRRGNLKFQSVQLEGNYLHQMRNWKLLCVPHVERE